MASIYKRSRDKARKNASWYIGYVDETGKQRTAKGCPDKSATEAMARKLESEAGLRKRGVIDARDDGYRLHGARALAAHLDDWRGSMIARGRTAKHSDLSHTRAARVAELAKADRLSDLQPSRIQAALAAIKDAGRSLETVNHHRAAIRAFARWAKADGRMRDDPMAGVTGYNAREDVRHARRSLADDELARLIRSTECGPVVFHTDGPTRAMAYRIAAGTGFRVAELRSLTPESFRLDGPRPCVALRPSNAKNRRGVDQPINATLAHDIRHWLAGKPAGVPVLPLHHETAKMIRRDLEAAEIPYKTDEGFADFHSLRGTYITALVQSGASIKTVQTLARHSNPALTLARYARADLHDVDGAVDSLPDLAGPMEDASPLAMTGTDPARIPAVIGSELPVNSGREGAETDASWRDDVPPGEDRSGTQVFASGDVGRPETATDANGAERGGFEPPRPVSQSNGLANRRFRPLSHLSGSMGRGDRAGTSIGRSKATRSRGGVQARQARPPRGCGAWPCGPNLPACRAWQGPLQ